jgi:hypothetical protein
VLYAFGFDRIGVVAGDLYFFEPNADPGQEGAEQGVRLEVRLLERGELRGSKYSAQPIAIEQPVWRVDLLESVANPGSLDRAHHHPRFEEYEPGYRVFVDELTADPVGWLEKRLSNFDEVLTEARVDPSEVGASDIASVEAAAPEIVDAVRRLLDRIRAGELAQPPADDTAAGARVSWL